MTEPAKAEEVQVDQPSCSEGEVGKSSDKQPEVDVGEENSPDQSDTAQ